jgi:hypothetical protein
MSGYLTLNKMIIKLQKVCRTNICNENKSCKGHTNLHTLLIFWIYEMANMICKLAVIEALKGLVGMSASKFFPPSLPHWHRVPD